MVMSFGYEIMASLLQLGRAFCVFSNGGYLVRPTIILDPKKEKNSSDKIKIYGEKTIETLRNILKTIGDSYSIKGCVVMGKTGTARCAEKHGYSKTDHVYTFAGIVEKGNYKRVIITFINRPQKAHMWASEVAAPLFQRVAERMILLDSQDKKEIMI